jgi:hypothetical protein
MTLDIEQVTQGMEQAIRDCLQFIADENLQPEPRPFMIAKAKRSIAKCQQALSKIGIKTTMEETVDSNEQSSASPSPKDLAYFQYMNCEKPRFETIANLVGVSVETVRTWSEENDWKNQKQWLRVRERENLKTMYGDSKEAAKAAMGAANLMLANINRIALSPLNSSSGSERVELTVSDVVGLSKALADVRSVHISALKQLGL